MDTRIECFLCDKDAVYCTDDDTPYCNDCIKELDTEDTIVYYIDKGSQV